MDIWAVLDRFLADELPLDELAQWVATAPALERVLTLEELRSLRRLDDRSRDASRVARDVVEGIYEAHRPGLLARDRAARIARGMVAGEINVAAGTRALARLHLAGHEWIPVAFVGIATLLDERPASTESSRLDSRAFSRRLVAARRQERLCRAPALTAAHRLLEHLSAPGMERWEE